MAMHTDPDTGERYYLTEAEEEEFTEIKDDVHELQKGIELGRALERTVGGPAIYRPRRNGPCISFHISYWVADRRIGREVISF
jgi:hypothetical protein